MFSFDEKQKIATAVEAIMMEASVMPKFWSDDFDMDLLKVLPETEKLIGPAASVPVWTVGGTSYGRLNHPACWNTYGGLQGFFWLREPHLQRDEYGWFSIGGYVSQHHEIEATWLEMLRDLWVHGISMQLLPIGRVFCEAPRESFDRIMGHRRGWRKVDNIGQDYKSARVWVADLTSKLMEVISWEV